MPAPPVMVSRSGPGFARVRADVERLRKSDVLVGIPATATLRPKDPINNASLLFVLSNGSPLRGIPATPIVEPGVKKARPLFTPQLAKAAQSLVQNRPQEAEKYLARAGTIAVNSVKRMFTDNDWPPNAPSTIKRKGSDRRNIDTGALRRSMTFVVRVMGRQTKDVPPTP